MTPRRYALAIVLVVGCQRLPSLTPLSDSGGLELDPSTRIDRRAFGAERETGEAEGQEGVAQEDVDEVVVTAEVSKVEPRALDAGVVGDATAPPPAAAPELRWAGEYYGSDRFVWRGTDGREMVEVDDRAHTRVEDAGPKAVVISIVNSATGDVICPLHATTSGNRATIRPRETCFGSPEQAAVVTDGRATLEGDRLVLDFRGHLEPTGDEEGDEDEATREEGSYHFDGRRR